MRKLLATKVRPWAYILTWAALLAVAAESAQERDVSSLCFIAVAMLGFYLTTEFTVLDRIRVRMMVEDELERLGFLVKGLRANVGRNIVPEATAPIRSSGLREPRSYAPQDPDQTLVQQPRRLYDHEDDETVPEWLERPR